MKSGLSGREALNGAAKPGPDRPEINVFDIAKSVRAKNRGNAFRLEPACPALTHLLEMFGPVSY